MTQEPANPEDSKPSAAPASAWAPRPGGTSPPEPEATPTTESEPSPAEPEIVTPSAAEEPVVETPAVPVTATAVAEPPPPPTKRSGVPGWVLLIVAIVSAVIVGLAVYFTVGRSDDGDPTEAASVVDGLMRLGRSDQSNVQSYAGELPPDFATDFPAYEDAEVVVSIAIASEQGTGYLIVLSSPNPVSDVFDFYSDALDEDPWQVEIGRSSDDFTGLRFLRPDNIDISGDVTLHQSDIDERTVIYLSYNDISQAILPGDASSPFTLGVSRPLPVGFPEDIPVYEGREPTVVLDTYFERGAGGQAFIVTFLTRDSQADVIDYYRDEFESRGWNVSDSGVSSTSFALAIEFDDGPDQSVSGSITADTFEDDQDFTQVDLLVTTSSN